MYEISPGHLSVKEQNTVCWSKGNDCSEAEHDHLQAPIPWEQCSSHFREAVPDKEVKYATHINVIYKSMNKL